MQELGTLNRKSATVHKVAERAGVSIATVSRVARGIGQVSPETRERVQAAIAELGYRPSHLGVALVARRHDALGLVFPGLSGPYFSEVINGFESQTVAARQAVLILGTHMLGHGDEQVLEMATRVDGIAIFGGTVADSIVHGLLSAGIPTVLMAGHPISGAPVVRAENYRSALALNLHLIRDHGYHHLAFIGDTTNSPDVGDRWRGFVDAHRMTGLDLPGEPIRTGIDQAGGLVATRQLLDLSEPPRAIVCANDEIALGAYSVAQARGIQIPDHLAITGWDDISMASLVSPPLSTIRQPMRDLGARTAQLLLSRIRGEELDETDIVLPTKVVIRASCGCSQNGPHSPDLP